MSGLDAFPVTGEQLALIQSRVQPLLGVSLATTTIERLLCEAYFQGALDTKQALTPPVRQPACGNDKCHTNRETNMTVVERDASGKPTIWCDPCIAPMIKALNDVGLKTVASCCGHGWRPANLVLADGRRVIIARDETEAASISALFPQDINGDTNWSAHV